MFYSSPKLALASSRLAALVVASTITLGLITILV